ncbi:hypothetical protein K438DRAFT_1857558 [Mycena galopus ATCC 62051]|nr:hypothetical protein K438DRAFT_1857558 [Mycena galopus ATCC 62051]
MSTQSYIVMFNKDATAKEIEDVKKNIDKKDILHTYNIGDFRGFAARLNPKTLTKFTSLRGGVIESIEPDDVVYKIQITH